MGDTGQRKRPDLKLLEGGGRGEARALQRLLGQPHAWLLKLGALFAVLAVVAFLLIPAFDRRAPRLTAEEVATAMAAAGGFDPVVEGLVEVLDLDRAQALKLKQTLERFDEAAGPPRRAREAALEVLRGAAAGSQAEASAVDLALGQRRQAQAQLEALDADLVEAVSAGLTPSQKARVAIVLGHYLQRGEAEGRAALPQAAAGPAGPAATPPPPPATTAPAARP